MAIHRVAPHWLIFVEGLNYSTDFRAIGSKPPVLTVANRLVYSPHDYSWFHNDMTGSDSLRTSLGQAWGFLITQNKPYTAPVMIGEFGTCNTAAGVPCMTGSGTGQMPGFWYQHFRTYLAAGDFDWAYWNLNGTQSAATDPISGAVNRTHGTVDTFGVLNSVWTGPARSEHLASLTPLIPATQGP